MTTETTSCFTGSRQRNTVTWRTYSGTIAGGILLPPQYSPGYWSLLGRRTTQRPGASLFDSLLTSLMVVSTFVMCTWMTSPRAWELRSACWKVERIMRADVVGIRQILICTLYFIYLLYLWIWELAVTSTLNTVYLLEELHTHTLINDCCLIILMCRSINSFSHFFQQNTVLQILWCKYCTGACVTTRGQYYNIWRHTAILWHEYICLIFLIWNSSVFRVDSSVKHPDLAGQSTRRDLYSAL